MAISQITGNSIANSTITINDLNFNPVPSNGSINIGQLDAVYSNGAGGMIIPGGADTIRPTSNVANGTIRFSSSNNVIELFANGAWATIGTGEENPASIDYVVVAGGGSGGGSAAGLFESGAGGGGGGFLTGTSYGIFVAQDYTVTVGAGGAATPASIAGPSPGALSYRGTSGANSAFGPAFTAIGGGAGGGGNSSASVNEPNSSLARPGGSGGGAMAYASPTLIGNGTVPQGNNGGQGSPTGSVGSGSGGGGGAGAVGANGSGTTGGAGGTGVASSISPLTFSGGGGGAGTTAGAGGTSGGPVGSPGGSGSAGTGNTTNVGGSGSSNRGGGGGGGATGPSPAFRLGGNGGSGVVIIKYPATFKALSTISPALTFSLTAEGGYKIYTFTGGTGSISWQ